MNDTKKFFEHLDIFTPHVRMVSLGGIQIHEGAWTVVEVLKKLHQATRSLEDSQKLIFHEQRAYAQLKGLRLTWESSLVGMDASSLGCIWVDGRYDEKWIEISIERAIEELFIWQKSQLRLGQEKVLKVIVWIEQSKDLALRQRLNVSLNHSIERLKRTLHHLQIHIVTMLESCTVESTDLNHSIFSWTQCLLSLDDEDFFGEYFYNEDEDWEQAPYLDALVHVPAGLFYQGGPSLSSSNEKPKHQVKISKPFWVSQTPITNGFWQSVMFDQDIYDAQAHLPASEISWFDALRFCNRLSLRDGLHCVYNIEDHDLPQVTLNQEADGYRLLTESEWEYMCLGGISNSLSAPHSRKGPAWTKERAQLKTHPVAQLSSNPWGIYDSLGNVAEWCQDVYIPDIYKERKKEHLSVDPCQYRGNEEERVIRGGSFDTPDYLATPSRRDACHPQKRWFSIGFRVVKPKITLN